MRRSARPICSSVGMRVKKFFPVIGLVFLLIAFVIYLLENSACFANHPTSDVMKQFDKNTFWPKGCEKRAEMTLAANFVRFQTVQLQLSLRLAQATSGFLDSGSTQVIQSRNKIMGLAYKSIEEKK